MLEVERLENAIDRGQPDLRASRSGANLRPLVPVGLSLILLAARFARAEDSTTRPTLEHQIMPLLKARCVKCHGPAKHEGKLSLATAAALRQGGKHEGLVVPGQPDESLLWSRVADEEMPPDQPLSHAEKTVIQRWIEQGAEGLSELDAGGSSSDGHWAFMPLRRPVVPVVRTPRRVRGTVDRFLQSALEAKGLSLGPEADRATLLRRLSVDLTGLPPTPDETNAFLADDAHDAYDRMVERYLASPHYGERWGKYWLDAAGYADSNGYFDVDTDRPLAYRYRDYVIRSWNEDVPLDRFIREQLAGDELSSFRSDRQRTPELVNQLEATHFLRNAPDGTDDSNGNPDILRADRYAVLEGTIEILGSSLFGMTFQCARCHDHKFEPITQQDYYQLQAILYPAFPVDRWVNPKDRTVDAALPSDIEAWKVLSRTLDEERAKLRDGYRTWLEANRAKGTVLFKDDFDEGSDRLAPRWKSEPPGGHSPGTSAEVHVDSEVAPGAVVKNGTLRVIESGALGDRRLSTATAFDWTPDKIGGWVQATFDLVDRRLSPDGKPADWVGYYIALHDDRERKTSAGGNLLLDGNARGGASLHLNYPGSGTKELGTVGKIGYDQARRYGIRVTNVGEGSFRLEHLIDWIPEGPSVTVAEADLPDGGFGFQYCCGRSFVVDNVLIEAGIQAVETTANQVRTKWTEYESGLKAVATRQSQRPGLIAWVSDLSAAPPEVHLLRRGQYADRGPAVEPNVPSVLRDPDNPFKVVPPAGMPSTGRRLALAQWITRPDSRAAALLARVTANRIWQYHFGTGLVATPANLGYSGAPPSNPALLEDLACGLVESGWSAKALHRRIVTSTAYRQSSASISTASAVDPDNRLLWRYPMQRLDADAVRDAMLAASGELDGRIGGPYVPAVRAGTGDVLVSETADGAHRRSIYLQQRRTGVVSLLEVFDAPSIVTSCTKRNATTMPLQSLSLLNSDFVRTRATALARRLAREDGPVPEKRLAHVFMLATGRPPSRDEVEASLRFLEAQPRRYPGQAEAADLAWTDLCQMILASNAFLYVE